MADGGSLISILYVIKTKCVYICVGDPNTSGSVRSSKKRRREKHHRYSPEPAGSSQVARPHKRKRKRKSVETPEAEAEQNRPALKIFVSVLS